MQFIPVYLLALLLPCEQAAKYWTEFVKPFIELRVPDGPDGSVQQMVHDRTIQLCAMALGMLTMPILAMAIVHHSWASPAQTVTEVVVGAGAGLAAIGDYHLLDWLGQVRVLSALGGSDGGTAGPTMPPGSGGSGPEASTSPSASAAR